MKREMIENEDCFDVLILGGGVVGLTVLRSATLAGWSCALVEAQEDLLSCASGSNSGIICTGVDASPGTLERALIRDSISQIRPFCRQHNIPMRECGSLVCQWPWDSESQEQQQYSATPLSKVLEESWDAGDSHASLLTPAEVQQMEPNLSTLCQGAVHIPGEIVVDPWLFSITLAVHARENGATIYTNFTFDAKASSYNQEEQVWTAARKDVKSSAPKFIKAKVIVNATGIQADVVQAQTNGAPPPHWSARPRRGQYRLFSSNRGTRIQCPIQPVPTQRTKGIFVFSTLYNQIVVGPTALDQESRTDHTADPAVADLLTNHVLRIIPDLDPETTCVGEYVGIRPGTDCRDYQIQLSVSKHWITAAGIRSTGLTASIGIGRHVTHLLHSILPTPSNVKEVVTTPLPQIEELMKEYHDRSDGLVSIDGNLYRVTHPITKYGWAAASLE